MSPRGESKIGAACAILGSVLLLAATYLHPVPSDPNDSVAAFTMYAADGSWVAIHLAQLTGFMLMMAALLVLAGQLEGTISRAWSLLAAGGAIASLAVATVLQADGIALKIMVDVWTGAGSAERSAAFHAAFAVRQVEVGLDSTLSLLLGLTATMYGLVLLGERTYPKWIGGLAIVGAVPMTVAGVAIAYTGFSSLAMEISMPASSVLLIWMLALGVLMWRRRRIL